MAGADSCRSLQRGMSSRNLGRMALTASLFSRLRKISDMPNRPMASAVKESPSARPRLPKVKRGMPVSWSRPTVPTARPRTIMVAVLSGDPAETNVIDAKRHQHQRHLDGLPDRHHDARKRRRDQHQPENGNRAADEAADGGDHQRRPCASLASHLVAIDTGDDGGSLAGNAHEDRGGRAAVHGAVKDAGQHDDAGGWIEAEGERQEQGHAGQRPEAREDADNGPPQAADEAIEQAFARQCDRKARHQLVEGGHQAHSEGAGRS